MPPTVSQSSASVKSDLQTGQESRAYNGLVEDVFANRLRKARKHKGLSQQRLANACGAPPNIPIPSREAISQWESATTRPSFEYIARLATALDVSADYLLGLSDQEKPPKLTEETGMIVEIWADLPANVRETVLHALKWSLQQEQNGRRNTLDLILEQAKALKHKKETP